MNHQGLRWSVHCVANVGPGKRLNLYKRGFKIYDLLVSDCGKQSVAESFCFKISSLIWTQIRERKIVQDNLKSVPDCIAHPYDALWDGYKMFGWMT